MEERIDLLDELGNLTGRSALKSEAHKKGWFHPTVHIWFFTANGKILIQQRSLTKDTHPGLWDVSVAGHILSGEAVTQAALREIEEEIGLKIKEEELNSLGIFKSVQHHMNGIKDCEFHHCYVCRLDVPLSSLKKQDEEVEDLKLISLIQFAEEVWGLADPSKYVPHEKTYYQAVIRKIKSLT